MIKSLFKKLKFYYNKFQNNIRVSKIESNTNELIKNKESDIQRWKKDNELFEDWNKRTAILAKYIVDDSKVIEFGAGVMYMKKILNNSISYTPSDVVKRYDETLVCDLNQPISFDLSNFDTIVFSGVLEYVYDVENIICKFSEVKINNIILSYCCSDIVLLSRNKNGWLSSYTKIELETIFTKYNYEILDYQEWNKQSIYNLRINKN